MNDRSDLYRRCGIPLETDRLDDDDAMPFDHDEPPAIDVVPQRELAP